MLTLKSRSAKLGSSINTRAEKHGDEDITAFDIPISGFMLTRDELEAVLQVPKGWHALFDEAPDTPPVPVFPNLKPMQLREKIENATVHLWIGLERVMVKLTDVNLARIRLEPQLGGYTDMQFQIQCTPDLDAKWLGTLLARLNHDLEVAVECEGFGAQAGLDLRQPAA